MPDLHKPSTTKIGAATRLLFVAVAALCVSLLLVGCSDSSSTPATQADGSQRRPQTRGFAGNTVTNLDFLAQAAQSLITGTAIYDADFADPFVYREGGDFWAYATNTQDAHVPVLASTGGGVVDALPDLPEWTTEGYIWSPSVAKIGDQMVLYYATAALGRMCISVGIADNPLGPFVDTSSEPLICPYDDGGVIDPSPYEIDGKRYLTWKIDGNCCDLPTSIVASELSADGTKLVGETTTLLTPDQDWEGGLIEAPSMTSLDGNLVLAYSANAWDSANYAVGAATCEGPLGPCSKLDGPFLHSEGSFEGPGGEEWFTSPLGDTMLVFHAWPKGDVNDADIGRHLYLEVVEWDGGPKLVGQQRARTALVVLIGSILIVAVGAGVVLNELRKKRRDKHSKTPSPQP